MRPADYPARPPGAALRVLAAVAGLHQRHGKRIARLLGVT
jgi:hypothetical protein